MKSKNKKIVPKIITKEEQQDSFFNFFNSLDETKSQKKGETTSDKQLAIAKNKESQYDLDEEDTDDLLRIADFEIGQYLREKIIPKAVLYYCGEYDGLEDLDEEYEDEDDEDDDDVDDDEDEEDSGDDSDNEKKGMSGSNKKLLNTKNAGKTNTNTKPGTGGAEPTPSECKQN